MIVLMRPQATEADVAAVCAVIEGHGLKPARWPGEERVVVGAIGDERVLAGAGLERLAMVQAVIPVLSPYKAVARAAQPEDTVVRIGAAELGGSRLVLGLWTAALRPAAQALAAQLGAQLLAELPPPTPLSPYVSQPAPAAPAAGAPRPGSAPGALPGAVAQAAAGALPGAVAQAAAGTPGPGSAPPGLADGSGGPAPGAGAGVSEGGAGLPCLRPPSAQGGGPVALTGASVEDPGLLDALGAAGATVALVRAPATSVASALLAAERLWVAGGRAFFVERAAPEGGRWRLDVSAIAALKQISHLPVMAHPGPLYPGSGAAALARAAVAVGADGLWLEPGPEASWPALAAEAGALRRLAEAIGRPFR